MTVANPYSPNIYTASGSQAAFAFTFQIISDTNAVPDITTVEVQLNGVIQSSGFTTVANQDQEDSPGGTVTFNPDPTVGTIVTLSRVTPVTQLLDFPLAAKFSTAALEVAFDKTCMEVQENEYLLETSAQAQQAPVAYAIPQSNPTMSGFDWVEPVQAGNVILDGGVGNPFASGPITSAAGGNVVAPGGGATIGHLASYAATNGQTLADSGIAAANVITTANLPVYPPVNGGRLYLNTGSPYSDSNATGTIYFGPTNSKMITLANGLQTFSEVSASLGSLAAGMYDIYVNSISSIAVALSFSSVWSGLTTPPTRSIDSYGRLCKNGDTTKLLVGFGYVNGSNQTINNTSSRWLQNLFNRQRSAMSASKTYSGSGNSSTTGPVDANTTDGQGRVSFVQGITNDALMFFAAEQYATVGNQANSVQLQVGAAIDSTTVFGLASVNISISQANTFNENLSQTVTVSGPLTSSGQGWHYLQQLENSATTGYGTVGNSQLTADLFN